MRYNVRVITLTVRYFGGARELAGANRESIELGATDEASLRAHLGALHPRLGAALPQMRLAINGAFAPTTGDAILADGDEVDLLPPVAGGAPTPEEDAAARVPLCRIDDRALSVDEAMAAVGHDAAGAIGVFTGVVRDHAEGKAVARLDYEHHPTLALEEMRRVLVTVAADHPTARVGAVHRVGQLAVGDLAVVVAASAPHRDEAFRACRAAIDRIKETVPIWKKEWGPGGDAHWVNLDTDG